MSKPSKYYDSYEQVDQQLEVYRLQRELAWRKLEQQWEEGKSHLEPLQLTGAYISGVGEQLLSNRRWIKLALSLVPILLQWISKRKRG